MELSQATEICVPREVLDDGYDFMRVAGRMRLEGMVLWAGKADSNVVAVTELIVPKQKGLSTADGLCAVVEAEELRRLNLYLYRNSLELIGQVHTHPGAAYHSQTDDQYAIATTIGAFSIVVPNFAARNYELSECAVYRLDDQGSWNEVDESAHPNKIKVV